MKTILPSKPTSILISRIIPIAPDILPVNVVSLVNGPDNIELANNTIFLKPVDISN